MSDSASYQVIVDCKNCGGPNFLAIPKGTTVGGYIRHNYPRCLYCQCSTLAASPAELVTYGT